MRRKNLFPYADMADTSNIFTPQHTKSDIVTSDDVKWLKATVTAVGDNYAQYTVKKNQSGRYHVGAIAKADGGTGSFRIYLHVGDGYQIPCQASLDDGKPTVCDMGMTVPDDCEEILVRLVPKGGVGASAMIRDISIEPTSTYALASGGGFRASSPRRPLNTDAIEAGDRR